MQKLIRSRGILSRFYFLPALLLLSSCSSLYYAPSQPVMPMVTEKGTTKLGMSMGGGEHSTAFDLNGFHSVSDHVGILADFAVLNLDLNQLWQADVGAGYFTSIAPRWGFEAYATVGYGSLQLLYYDWWTGASEYRTSTGIFRSGVLPDIFYHSEHFEAGMGVRLQYFSLNDVPEDPTIILATQDHLMLEPTLRMAFGWDVFKFSVQGTWTDKINDGYLNYDTYMISGGITVKLRSKQD